MRFIRLLLEELRMQVRLFPVTALVILITPLLLAVFMSFVQSASFQNSAVFQAEPITIEDEDGTEVSGFITELFEEELTDYFTVSSNEASMFTVTIPAGYTEGLADEVLPMEIHATMNASISDGQILSDILTRITRELREQAVLAQLFSEQALSAAEQQQISSRLSAAAAQPLWKPVEHRGPGAYTSQEYYSITLVGFLLAIFISSVLESKVGDKNLALRKRYRAAPVSAKAFLFINLINFTLLFCFISIAYYAIWKLFSPGTFRGPFIGYAVLFLVHGLTAAAIVELLSLFTSKRGAKTLNAMLGIVFILFSGYIPLDRMLPESAIASFMSDNPLKWVTIDPYFKLHNTGSISGNSAFITVALILAGLMIFVSFIFTHLRKEA